MKAKVAWGPVSSVPDTKQHLSTSPLPSLPEGQEDAATPKSPSRDPRSLAESPRSPQRSSNGPDGGRRRSHSAKHLRRKSESRSSSSSPQHGSKDARGASSTLAKRQGRGGEEGKRQVSGHPSSEARGVNLHLSESLAVVEEEDEEEEGERWAKKRSQDGQPVPGSDVNALSDPVIGSGVAINITPSPASSEDPTRASSSFASSATSPHSRLEEDGPNRTNLRPDSEARVRPWSSKSAVHWESRRPSSGRPHSHHGDSRRPSTRARGRLSTAGASSRRESSLQGRRWTLRKSSEEWEESPGSRSHLDGETHDLHMLAAQSYDSKPAERRRPWTAPPTIRVRPKRDYMEREEAFQAALRDRQGVGSRHEMAPPYHHPHYSDQAKQKHEEVIRQILDDFDLEETKDKYRNSNACEFRREGTSLADFKFRSELMRLMGSEVIRISDTTWATRFQQKLREDYERKLEEKAHVLAEAEHERVHRLRLEGIMTGKASNRSEDLMKKAFTVNRMKSPLQRPVPQQSGTKTRKESVPKGSQPVFKDEQCNIRERELSARRTARTYQPPVTVHTVIEEVKKIEAEEEQSAKDTSSQEAGTTSTELEERKEPVEEEQTLTFSFGQLQKKKSATADERRLRLFKRLPPFVVKLYEAETVSSLYECAEQIVGSARAPKAPEVSDPEDAGFVRFMDSKAVHR